MNQHDARTAMSINKSLSIEAWADKAINRANGKITLYTTQGKNECELDFKYPPRNPDDKTSAEVAEIVVSHFESNGYACQLVQRVNHLGAICRIKWAGSKRLDANS